jgi:hypothetical protein
MVIIVDVVMIILLSTQLPIISDVTINILLFVLLVIVYEFMVMISYYA